MGQTQPDRIQGGTCSQHGRRPGAATCAGSASRWPCAPRAAVAGRPSPSSSRTRWPRRGPMPCRARDCRVAAGRRGRRRRRARRRRIGGAARRRPRQRPRPRPAARRPPRRAGHGAGRPALVPAVGRRAAPRPLGPHAGPVPRRGRRRPRRRRRPARPASARRRRGSRGPHPGGAPDRLAGRPGAGSRRSSRSWPTAPHATARPRTCSSPTSRRAGAGCATPPCCAR